MQRRILSAEEKNFPRVSSTKRTEKWKTAFLPEKSSVFSSSKKKDSMEVVLGLWRNDPFLFLILEYLDGMRWALGLIFFQENILHHNIYVRGYRMKDWVLRCIPTHTHHIFIYSQDIWMPGLSWPTQVVCYFCLSFYDI